ncbi:glycoside hydrolase family 2 protein [Bacteroidota bacterium]
MLLNRGWEFRLVSSREDILQSEIKNTPGKWLPATVPGTVHTDLLNNNLIPDPFYSDNEKKLDWIDFCDWEYRTTFNIDNADYDSIVFEGIDTIAEIYLNDILLCNTKNMFVEYSFNIRGKIKNDANNLRIVFRSAKNIGKKNEDKYGKLTVAHESERVYLRKAQYSFGWDWGPSFPTLGIWKNVYLEKSPECKISDVRFATMSIDDNIANLSLTYDLNGQLQNIDHVLIQLENDEYKHEEKVKSLNQRKNLLHIQIENPKLWFPNGMGEQNLYILNIIVAGKDNRILDQNHMLVGIRTIELQLENNNESNFRFLINGTPIYIKGVNWIPVDSFLPRVNKDKYIKLLSLAKNANVNMVRVWGGGIYENDLFYETCCRLGLLVWQDFMFACATYPKQESFMENVREEINYQVSRLRNYPSLTIWCGNNENEWIWYQQNKVSYKNMPDYKLYHEFIPKLLKDLGNSHPYWPTSPFGFDEDPNSFNSGNTHQWQIWSQWVDYENVLSDESLFVTEFGFQAPANIDTLNKVLPPDQRRIQSEIFEYHNKQVDGPERLVRFLSKHLPLQTEWEDYLYLTQLNQGFALKTCIEHWRTNNRTNGSIIWQLNDCWPVSSWSIIDSDLYPKLAYYFVKDTFSDFLICFKNDENKLDVLIQNCSTEDFKGRIELHLLDIKDCTLIEKKSVEVNIKCGNETKFFQDILTVICSESKTLKIVTLYSAHDEVVNKNYHIDEKWKHISLPKVRFEIRQINNNTIEISTDNIALFVDLYHPGIQFQERGFILLPNENKRFKYVANENVTFNRELLRLFSLNNYLAK